MPSDSTSSPPPMPVSVSSLSYLEQSLIAAQANKPPQNEDLMRSFGLLLAGSALGERRCQERLSLLLFKTHNELALQWWKKFQIEGIDQTDGYGPDFPLELVTRTLNIARNPDSRKLAKDQLPPIVQAIDDIDARGIDPEVGARLVNRMIRALIRDDSSEIFKPQPEEMREPLRLPEGVNPHDVLSDLNRRMRGALPLADYTSPMHILRYLLPVLESRQPNGISDVRLRYLGIPDQLVLPLYCNLEAAGPNVKNLESFLTVVVDLFTHGPLFKRPHTSATRVNDIVQRAVSRMGRDGRLSVIGDLVGLDVTEDPFARLQLEAAFNSDRVESLAWHAETARAPEVTDITLGNILFEMRNSGRHLSIPAGEYTVPKTEEVALAMLCGLADLGVEVTPAQVKRHFSREAAIVYQKQIDALHSVQEPSAALPTRQPAARPIHGEVKGDWRPAGEGSFLRHFNPLRLFRESRALGNVSKGPPR